MRKKTRFFVVESFWNLCIVLIFNVKMAKRPVSDVFAKNTLLENTILLSAENQEVKYPKVEKKPSFFIRHKCMKK